MNSRISIKRSTFDILNRFEQYSAEDKLNQRPLVLKQLIDSVGRLPEPASGLTYQRWQVFAQIAGFDLSLAKLFESHCDALSILHELGYENEIDEKIWAVWAADGGPAPLQVENELCQGIKQWCSGAEFIQKALISFKDQQGQSQLCIVDLNQSSIKVDLDQWQAVGMQGTQTARVNFQDTAVKLIGRSNDYLDRSGFWHGAAGVAACWYGAAVRLIDELQQNCLKSPNPFKKMYLGQLASQLAVIRQYFQYVAQLIDSQPKLSHEREVRILRGQVEQSCLAVIEGVGKALGARPFCEQATFASLMVDLPVFIRQSHAAFDDEQIAERCLQEQVSWQL
ncbi:acyl-CoA/acyl-ACP dehydrogenase [Acinetobacter haemolyticus]|uniref:acyl-CoA/acyl-ACP dehydrogenase n=1 Tax=Acinetobacter haemolyticus TaxID=29430 RepID=UPI000F7366DE|nr:acyl-CoA/acyl-ACP dehydrogenase [Acinetobacter haemolyticus]RSN77027.1 acyl-CoA dehydrogenase [Acinetobacter haemolyticus]